MTVDDAASGAKGHDSGNGTAVRPAPDEVRARLDEQIREAGGIWEEPAAFKGSVGRTMFDSPSSEDNTVTVLLPREHLQALPSQALVRIVSRPDGREYLGVVVAGPFAEPDGLRADAPLVVTTAVHGGVFMPRFHGRVQVDLLGERVDGVLQPPRYRPLPNSPVFVLGEEETADVLRVGGDIRLGLAVGHEHVPVGLPSARKSVLPRHTAIVGTTGGGKSTTVAGLIAEAQRAGLALVLLDVEGEYTHLDEPTDDQTMVALLRRQGRHPAGVPETTIYHLVGRETANPEHPRRVPFSLRFSDLSPYAVAEIVDLTDPQAERYWLAYEVTKKLLDDLGIARVPEERLDEFEAGYEGMTLDHLLDVVGAIAAVLGKGEPSFRSRDLGPHAAAMMREVEAAKIRTSHPNSWRSLIGKLGRLQRLRVFDNPAAGPLDYARLLESGQVGIVDLSGTDLPDMNNLAIAAILRGIQQEQERLYSRAERGEDAPPRTLVIIEEAHEFLAKERIDKMPHLFAQVARIAKRGRKRWLGLVFVTQLPQHLPSQVLGLVNNWVVHKIGDAGVIATLQRSVGGIDESLWKRLPGLAPGQAVVSFTHMHRPVLTAIDPTPAKLRMVE
jgi:DNA helicase HerA-like ATPase